MIEERSFDDMALLVEALALDIVVALEAAIELRGRAGFVVTGGRTPASLYEALARRGMRWRDVAITLSDERWVAVDDVASNEGMIRRTLLAGAPSAARFVPLKTAALRPADAEPEVERAVAEVPMPFDVCLLGIGEDGHVASLFPGLPMHGDGHVQPAYAPAAAGAAERLSLTIGALAASRWICLLFTGADKLSVFRAAQNGLSETPLGVLLAMASGRVSAYWCAETVS